MSPDKEYFSLEEVAEKLGVTYQLIYRLVRDGRLPAARLGKLYRVSGRDLDLYLAESKRATTGGTCTACGRSYESRLSLTEACRECGAPICRDCWTRLGRRACREHGAPQDGG